MEIYLNEKVNLNGTDWTPANSQEVEENILELISCLNAFNYHIDYTVIYSGEGFSRLISNLGCLDSLLDYSLTNPINQLAAIIFEIGAKNWDEEIRQKQNVNYYYQLGGGATNMSVNGTTLAEVCESDFIGMRSIALLCLLSAQFNNTNPINIIRSQNIHPVVMTLHNITIVSRKTNLIDFLKLNRIPPRIFNWNKKHGEFNKGVLANKDEEVSPLEGSRKEAEVVLKDAIGKRGKGDLWGYDGIRAKFMEFKYDGKSAQNSYHGYHPIHQDEIDQDVKDFLLDN